MKTAKAIGLALPGLLTLLALPPGARADDLFYDGACVSGQGLLAAAAFPAAGLTCEDIRQYGDAVNVIRAALMPATTAMLLAPGAKDMIAGELAELGLTYANPAVLGVTVIGATGVTVAYFILKVKMDECERMARDQLKEEIGEELQRKYGLKAPPALNLELKR